MDNPSAKPAFIKGHFLKENGAKMAMAKCKQSK